MTGQDPQDPAPAQDLAPANDNGGKMPARQKRCVICGKPATVRYDPFCSARCADVDLNRWLGGVYAVPASATDDEEELPPDI